MLTKPSRPLRVVILTGSGKTIVEPLMDLGINIVGLSEVYDAYNGLSLIRKRIENLYWKWVKRKNLPYLSCFARQKNIPYSVKLKNQPAPYIDWLKNLKPDVLVLHQAPILPANIYSIPRFETINIHPSLLPKYRGSNPYFWLYYYRDFNAGITLHYLDETVDTGDIISQSSYQIEPGTHYTKVAYKLIHGIAIPMLVTALRTLEQEGELKVTPQPAESPVHYARRVSNQEYRELLDFENWDIEHLWHVLNANEQWRDTFLPSIRHSNWYAWSLKGFEKRSVSEPFGVVDKDRQGFYLKQKQGVIYFTRKIKVTKIITNLV